MDGRCCRGIWIVVLLVQLDYKVVDMSVFSDDKGQVIGWRDAPIHQFFLDVSVMRLTCIVELRDRCEAWGVDVIVGVLCPVDDRVERVNGARCGCITAAVLR